MTQPGGRLKLTATLALGQIAGRGALAVGLLILIRKLDSASFGNFALALALVQILAAVADGGFSRLLVRDVARRGTSGPGLARALLRTRMLGVVIVVSVTVLGLAVIPGPFSAPFVALMATYLFTESVAFGFENAAVGVERPWRFVSAQVAGGVVLLGGLSGLASTEQMTMVAAMATLALSSTVKVTGHLVAWRHSHAGLNSGRKPVVLLYREALPFLGLSLLATVYYRVGVIGLHLVKGAATTAPYAAALRLVDLVAVLAGVIFSGVSPTLSRMHHDHPREVYAAWRRMTLQVGSLSVPVVAGLILLAPTLSRLLFGRAYAHDAGTEVRILAPGMALMVLQAVTAAVVFMADERRDVIRLTIVNVSVCVVASFALSAALGGPGTALALALSEALSFFSFARLVRRRYGRSLSHGREPCRG